MKETFYNLKRVYKYGKKYKKNLIIFTLISVLNVIVNIVYPIMTAKQLVAFSTSTDVSWPNKSMIIVKRLFSKSI